MIAVEIGDGRGGRYLLVIWRAGTGIHTSINGPCGRPDANARTYNALHTGPRAIGERANSELKQRWR